MLSNQSCTFIGFRRGVDHRKPDWAGFHTGIRSTVYITDCRHHHLLTQSSQFLHTMHESLRMNGCFPNSLWRPCNVSRAAARLDQRRWGLWALVHWDELAVPENELMVWDFLCTVENINREENPTSTLFEILTGLVDWVNIYQACSASGHGSSKCRHQGYWALLS